MKKALILVEYNPKQLENDGHMLQDKLDVLCQHGITVVGVDEDYPLDRIDEWAKSLLNDIDYYADSQDWNLTHEQKLQIVEEIRDYESIGQEVNDCIQFAYNKLGFDAEAVIPDEQPEE